MPTRSADAPLQHREIRAPRRHHLGPRQQQHGDVQRFGQHARGLHRLLATAEDQRHALAFQTDQFEIRRRDPLHGDERRHLRTGLRRLIRPARRLADIDEGKRARESLGFGDLGEKRRLLRAGHGHVGKRAKRLAKAVELGTAELMRRPPLGADPGKGLAVERHRSLAIAGQDRARGLWHGLSPAGTGVILRDITLWARNG
jgi:hypothetical protein